MNENKGKINNIIPFCRIKKYLESGTKSWLNLFCKIKNGILSDFIFYLKNEIKKQLEISPAIKKKVKT